MNRPKERKEVDYRTASRTRWPWARRGIFSTQYTNIAPDSPKEAKKLVLSNDLFGLLTWHLWAIISCYASAVLLYLNFSEYAIGTQVGQNTKSTRNALGILQLAAKAHEIIMIASMLKIARQLIQRCLIGDGILLGLVGAERSLVNLSFLISREFRSALGCTAGMLFRQKQAPDEWRRGIMSLVLVGFFSLTGLLCSVVGPASAVLIIPRYDWFHEREIYSLNYPYGLSQYPNVFIDPSLASHVYKVDRLPDLFQFSPDYWQKVWTTNKSTTEDKYQYSEGATRVTVNTTTTRHRVLSLDSDWDGATNLTGVMVNDALRLGEMLQTYVASPRNNGSEASFTAHVTGIESSTVCRRRIKQPCDNSNAVNGLEWCYLSVTKDSSVSQLRSSNDLLVIIDSRLGGFRPGGYNLTVWMTEGPRATADERFTESILFVFLSPGGYLNKNFTTSQNDSLIVCSTSARLKSAKATSLEQWFSADTAKFYEYLSYFDGNSTIQNSTRTFLYHENWLDSIHLDPYLPVEESHPSPDDIGLLYPSRSQSNTTNNKSLQTWVTQLLSAADSNNQYWWAPNGSLAEAADAEILVGGSYLSMLLALEQSFNQYAYHDPMEELMPEPFVDYREYVLPPVTIYHLVYGFRLSSHTGVSAAAVLIIHAFITILGSVWQIRKGNVIRAWGSTPEYVALCLGSELSPSEVENTCAGIDQPETFNQIVRIREITEEHLGIVVVQPDAMPSKLKQVDPKKSYGLRERKKKRGKKAK